MREIFAYLEVKDNVNNIRKFPSLMSESRKTEIRKMAKHFVLRGIVNVIAFNECITLCILTKIEKNLSIFLQAANKTSFFVVLFFSVAEIQAFIWGGPGLQFSDKITFWIMSHDVSF